MPLINFDDSDASPEGLFSKPRNTHRQHNEQCRDPRVYGKASRSGPPRSVPDITMHTLLYSASTLREGGSGSSRNSRRRTSVDQGMRRMKPPNRGSFPLGYGPCEHHPHPLTSLDPHHRPLCPLTLLKALALSTVQPLMTQLTESQQKRLKIIFLLTGKSPRAGETL